MTQPSDIIVSQRAPVRITPSASLRYTCSARKFSHTLQSWATALSKSSQWDASAAALMAPADVPVITGNGLSLRHGAASRRICATAFSTPTW